LHGNGFSRRVLAVGTIEEGPIMSLEISQETQAQLLQEAQKEGVSVDVLLQRLMYEREAGGSDISGSSNSESGQANIPSIAHLQRTNPREWARQFRAWADGHDPKIPVLSDEAMGRESIYPDFV
jgi:hypothetical protein